MYQEQLVPGGCCKYLALVAYPKSHPHGSSPSLSGAAAWRPLGDGTLTLNQHSEGHQLVFQKPMVHDQSPGSFSQLRHIGGLGKTGSMHVMDEWYD